MTIPPEPIAITPRRVAPDSREFRPASAVPTIAADGSSASCYRGRMNRPTDSIVAEGPARFSVEEFMAMAHVLDGLPGKVELVDRVIVRMSPANYPHFSI